MKKHFFLIMVLLISLIIPSLAVSGPVITMQPANELPFVMTDDQWIGLGAAAGRIVFDDQATDIITFSNADVLIGARITFGGDTNDDGITFGSLGTATNGIDLSSSGLSGSDDYWLWLSANDYWSPGGGMKVGAGIAYTVLDYITTLRSSAATTGQAGLVIYPRGGNVVLGSAEIGTNIIVACTANNGYLTGNSTTIGSWAADGVSSAGTANITDVGGAAHGLALAVGDLVHISNCTTASHKGFYRIVTAGATTIVLDRVLAATDTDLTVTFYQDVIGFFATDGTNGQRITGYSHTDKPLQIGGDVLAATGHSLGGEDVLIGGKLEVDDKAYFDGLVELANTVRIIGASSELVFYDDRPLKFGSSNDSTMLWESADANAMELILALPNGDATNVPVFVIGDQGIINVNLGWFDGITEPSIALVNAAENAYVRYGSTVNVSANSTGAGSILMKGTTARDSTGFLAITVTGTTYYIPFFTTITG